MYIIPAGIPSATSINDLYQVTRLPRLFKFSTAKSLFPILFLSPIFLLLATKKILKSRSAKWAPYLRYAGVFVKGPRKLVRHGAAGDAGQELLPWQFASGSSF